MYIIVKIKKMFPSTKKLLIGNNKKNKNKKRF